MAPRLPIPVILVGRQPVMGGIVTEHLKPEVEVIHFMATPEVAKQDLPLLIQHKQPSHSSDGKIGSQAYSQPAQAILLGLGYTNEIVDELREACKGLGSGVLWLAGGYTNPEFEEMMRTNQIAPPEKQGPITAEKVKKVLMELLEEGKGGKDGLYYWHKR